MLSRTLEAEVMDTEAEVRDYDSMDHAEVNRLFCDDLLRLRPAMKEVLDVGTGTARIPIELCTRLPGARVVGIDLADAMLVVAKENVARADLDDRIRLEKRDAKKTGWRDGGFDVVMSNTILHHIAEPADLMREMWRLAAPGGALFVRDLARPTSQGAVRALVDAYAAPEKGAPERSPGAHDRQRKLFEASLHASLTLDEIRALAAAVGIPEDKVQMTSDRHWTLACIK